MGAQQENTSFPSISISQIQRLLGTQQEDTKCHKAPNNLYPSSSTGQPFFSRFLIKIRLGCLLIKPTQIFSLSCHPGSDQPTRGVNTGPRLGQCLFTSKKRIKTLKRFNYTSQYNIARMEKPNHLQGVGEKIK